MKKILLLICILTPLSGFLWAQVQGGPDQFGYTWKDDQAAGGPGFEWIDITNTGTLVGGLGDDNVKGPFDIGFDFTYYWTTTNTFYVGSNGYISFDQGIQISSGGGPAFPDVPTADNNNNFLAPLLSDLTFGEAGNPGKVYYWSNNTDSLIVSFEQAAFWNQALDFRGSNTFQIILDAASKSIKFQYLEQTSLYDTAYSGMTNPAITGIENINGQIGLEVATDLFPAPRAILFEYPDSVTFTIVDVQPDWVNNPANGGFFLLANAGTILNASVSNVGNSSIAAAFPVSTEIFASFGGVPTGSPLYSESFSFGGMANGQSIAFSYGPTYTPTAAGIFHVITETALGTDVNNGNDNIETELQVIDTTGVQQVRLSFTDATLGPGTFGIEGAGVYYKPPFYPAEIVAVELFLADGDTTLPSDSFAVRIIADDGPNNDPGTHLFDSIVPQGTAVTINDGLGLPHMINLPTPVTIDSGGFYLSFEVDVAVQNTGIMIDQDAPFSLRTYEVINGNFGPNRNAATQDIYISAIVTVPSSGTQGSRPEAGFGASTFTICEGEDITFYNHALTATTYSWSFENGTPATSPDENPLVTFNTAGTWTITQIVSNANGSDTATNTITVLNTVTADFTTSTDTITLGETVTFTNASQNETAIDWDFGDGETSTAENPEHEYTSIGNFTVTMNAGNACGSDQKTTLIVVFDSTKPPDTNTLIKPVIIEDQLTFSIYPNPAGDAVFVETSNKRPERLEVYNLVGDLLLTQKPGIETTPSIRVNTSGLPEGMYLIKVYADGDYRTAKFSLLR